MATWYELLRDASRLLDRRPKYTRCACQENRHVLVGTSLLLLLPAIRLYKTGRLAYSTLLLLHSVCSTLFHWSHTPTVLRYDRALSHIVFASAVIVGRHDPIVCTCLGGVMLLWYLPVCREQGHLRIEAHVSMHLAAVVGLWNLP
jgi:hypothetical protein